MDGVFEQPESLLNAHPSLVVVLVLLGAFVLWHSVRYVGNRVTLRVKHSLYARKHPWPRISVRLVAVAILWLLKRMDWLFLCLRRSVKVGLRVLKRGGRQAVSWILPVYRTVQRQVSLTAVALRVSLRRTGALMRRTGAFVCSLIQRAGQGICLTFSAVVRHIVGFGQQLARWNTSGRMRLFCVRVLYYSLSVVVFSIFTGYLILLMPQPIVPQWSFDALETYLSGTGISEQSFRVLMPFMLALLIVGMVPLSSIAQPRIRMVKRSSWTRYGYDAWIAIVTSGTVVILWDTFKIWGIAGVLIVVLMGLLNALFAFLAVN